MIETQQRNDPLLPPLPAKKKKPNLYYLNSQIYDSYLRKNFEKSLSLIKNYQSVNEAKKTEFHLYMLGLINRQLTQFDKSLNYFKQCYMMNKNNFEYLKEMTKGMYVSGKYKPAMEAAKDACKLSEDQEILCIMGRIQLYLNNPVQACKYFEKSIEIQPSDEAYVQLSQIYMRLGKSQKAYSILQEGFKYAFENSQLLDMMGKISINIGKNNEAQIHFQKSLEVNRTDVKALLAFGSILQSKSQIEQAMEKYRTLHAVSPNCAQLWNNVGTCLMEKNKDIAAYCCFRKAVFLDSFEWRPIANLGMVCLKMRKHTLASIHFTTALSLNPNNTQVLNLLGISLTQLGDFNNAEIAFQQGISIEKMSTKYENSPSIYVNYFQMLLKKGDHSTAKKILQQARRRLTKEIGPEKLEYLVNHLESLN